MYNIRMLPFSSINLLSNQNVKEVPPTDLLQYVYPGTEGKPNTMTLCWPSFSGIKNMYLWFWKLGSPDMIYLFLIMGKMLNRDFSSYFDKKYTF